MVLKLTGEIFSSKRATMDSAKYDRVSLQLIEIVKNSPVQLALVVGGGNIYRGRQAGSEVDRSEADNVGMLGTVMNGINLRESLTRNHAPETRLMTALPIHSVAEEYIRLKAIHHLKMGRIIILAGGLGKPGFSTDSAVAKYGMELKCDLVLKASTVDGVYDSDPNKNQRAKRLSVLTYRDAIRQNLQVMDPTAFAICETSKIPIVVFDIRQLSRVPDIIKGDYSLGTLIH